MELAGKTALVTGAAHRVGKGIALALASQQTNIILHYGTSEMEAMAAAREIEELGVDVSTFSVDLNSPDAITSFVDVVGRTHSVDILVNSAASFVKKTLRETTLEDWAKAMNINVRAPMLLIQQLAPHLAHDDDGLVVNIADLSGVHAWSNFAVHGISKAGLIHLTRIAARELAPEVRVNGIIPGPILPPEYMDEDHPSWKEMISNLPLKRSGDPKNIGQAVVFLAQNDFVTGSVFNVDGGEMLIGPKNH